jgi:hypothetical protein
MSTYLKLEKIEKDRRQIIVFEQPSLPRKALENYTKGQMWSALRKNWKAYKISKAERNQVAMMRYADRIRSVQKRLGLPPSKFPNLGLN